jgi:hypothetical protein
MDHGAQPPSAADSVARTVFASPGMKPIVAPRTARRDARTMALGARQLRGAKGEARPAGKGAAPIASTPLARAGQPTDLSRARLPPSHPDGSREGEARFEPPWWAGHLLDRTGSDRGSLFQSQKQPRSPETRSKPGVSGSGPRDQCRPRSFLISSGCRTESSSTLIYEAVPRNLTHVVSLRSQRRPAGFPRDSSQEDASDHE